MAAAIILEVRQLFDTLIAEADQVYDVSLIDDQPVLGIKGTLSVVELKVLKMRLLQGMEAKARRGEVIRILPPGYVTDGTGKVVRDPNVRVRKAIELVFRKLRETCSIRQTLKWFHEQGVELPVNKSVGGRVAVVFQLPTPSFVGDVLRNPVYGGAYVYGRRPTELKLVDGRPVRRQGRVRTPAAARVFIRDHAEVARAVLGQAGHGGELLRVLSPLGGRASLEALERLTVADEDRRTALTRQLQQVEFEARRAFEQYNAVESDTQQVRKSRNSCSTKGGKPAPSARDAASRRKVSRCSRTIVWRTPRSATRGW